MPFKNKEAYNTWKREWTKKQRLFNPLFSEKNKSYCRMYKKKHKEKVKNWNKCWVKNNPLKVRLNRKRFILKKVPLIKRYLRFLKTILGCSICQERHIDCLQFHHTNPSNKVAAVTSFSRFGFNKNRIQEEVKKCIVLCSNCHDKHHAQERKEKTG